MIATRLPDFAHDLASCRTFAFHSDVVRLRAGGLAGGGSLDNAVVFDDTGGSTTSTTPFPTPLNPGGLRCPDEWARHKLLDAVGDLVLAGRGEGVLLVANQDSHRIVSFRRDAASGQLERLCATENPSPCALLPLVWPPGKSL